MNKKKAITIFLVFLVILLGGASIYVATQLSTRKAVAPTAPESKPKASEDEAVWVGSDACTVTGVATDVACVPTEVITCTTPLTCPTTCGLSQSLQTGCTNSCGEPVADKVCPATAVCSEDGDWSEWTACTATTCGTTGTKTHTCNNPVPSGDGLECLKADGVMRTTPTARTETVACSAAACGKVELEGNKTAYKNVTSNTPGVYTLSNLTDVVSKSQIYVYTIELKNISETIASGVVIKDSLANKPVTFMDTVAGCRYSATDLELTCNTSIEPDETKKFSFRVKVSDGVANGVVISNTGNVTYPGGLLDVTKNLAVSTVVGCNHTCTTIGECSTGLTCDTTTSKCRTATCLTEDDCNCPSVIIPTTTRAPSVTTTAPTKVATIAEKVVEAGEVITKATPTILPETGIFDLPGIAAFGGGLFLAIIGILLAL